MFFWKAEKICGEMHFFKKMKNVENLYLKKWGE